MDLSEEQQQNWKQLEDLVKTLVREQDLANVFYNDLTTAAFAALSKNKEKIYSRPLLPAETRCIFLQVQNTQMEIDELIELIAANALIMCVENEQQYNEYLATGRNVIDVLRENIFKSIGITESDWVQQKLLNDECIHYTKVPASEFFEQLTTKEIHRLQLKSQFKLIPFLTSWIYSRKNRLIRLLLKPQNVALTVTSLVCMMGM